MPNTTTTFPVLIEALGPPPKTLPFPGVIVCAACHDRPVLVLRDLRLRARHL